MIVSESIISSVIFTINLRPKYPKIQSNGENKCINKCSTTRSQDLFFLFQGMTDNKTGSISRFVQDKRMESINQAELNGCGNQTLRLAVAIGNGVVQQASWTIPSTSTPQTFYLSAWSTNSSALSNYYADILLTPFNASQAISTKYALNTFRTPY